MTVDFSTEEVYADINNQSLPEDELHKSTADVIYMYISPLWLMICSDSDYVIKPPYINDEQFDGPLLGLKKKSDSVWTGQVVVHFLDYSYQTLSYPSTTTHYLPCSSTSCHLRH